jgi:hypothetical protein
VDLDQPRPLSALEPDDEGSVEAILCPVCWEMTGAWLATPNGRATCQVCLAVFVVAEGEA